MASGIRSLASAAVPASPSSPEQAFAAETRERAIDNARTFSALPGLIDQFVAVSQAEAVRGDALVHAAYLQIRLGRWPAALASLRMAGETAHEAYLEYLVAYLEGRALQGAANPTAAIDAYRRALAIMPAARSASVLLAAQLLLRGRSADRVDAFAPLDDSLKTRPPAVDPWETYWHGQGRLSEADMTNLRQALR